MGDKGVGLVLQRIATRYGGEPGVPLRIRLWNGAQADLAPDPGVTLTLTSPAAVSCLLQPSLSGLAEAVVEGRIRLEGPVMEAVRIAEALTRRGPGFRPKARLWRPRHSRRTDAAAIAHHYDVSNDFYRLWLDRQMVYSCGYFQTGAEDIHQAQEQKLDYICRKLLLRPGERFLDIGCGWGGLILWAAKHYGVDATGITISRNQYEQARERIAAEGLDSRCRVLLQDYRDLGGEAAFDKIASVGMFEHVGQKNLPLYFGAASRLLKDGGLVLNHGIATSECDDAVHELGGGDFIGRYVFPDGETPHLSAVVREMGRQELEIMDVESLRPHYARTLSHWVERLEARRAEAEALAGSKRYLVWLVYMAGCAHAFERGWITVYQLLASKASGGLPALPLTRDHLYRAAEEGGPAWLRPAS